MCIDKKYLFHIELRIFFSLILKCNEVEGKGLWHVISEVVGRIHVWLCFSLLQVYIVDESSFNRLRVTQSSEMFWSVRRCAISAVELCFIKTTEGEFKMLNWKLQSKCVWSVALEFNPIPLPTAFQTLSTDVWNYFRYQFRSSMRLIRWGLCQGVKWDLIVFAIRLSLKSCSLQQCFDA